MNHHRINLLTLNGPVTSQAPQRGYFQTSLSPIGLSILRCTAQALASTPGGLRFVPGSRPWLDNLQAPQ